MIRPLTIDFEWNDRETEDVTLTIMQPFWVSPEPPTQTHPGHPGYGVWLKVVPKGHPEAEDLTKEITDDWAAKLFVQVNEIIEREFT